MGTCKKMVIKTKQKKLTRLRFQPIIWKKEEEENK